MKAMILAAGYGTRLRPYTDHTPKPLFSLGGRTLLDILIENLQKAGCSAVMINTHHLHDKIEAFIAGRSFPIPVATRYEPQILGTGGAIKNVADFWDHQPFMVVNSDIATDIDFKRVYDFHASHRDPATLVLCDDPEFNSVAVAQKKWVAGFNRPGDSCHQRSAGLLTFTGIQVLEPDVLAYIPDKSPSSSIEAFKRILADGKKIRAFVAKKDTWQDIGTPQRYREAAVRQSVPEAFRQAFGSHPGRQIRRVKLQGDGSQRHWHRLTSEKGSLIMADHGIRQTTKTAEVDSFVKIGAHLHRREVPVPQIYFFDTFSGLVFLEDLGDVSLQQIIRTTKRATTIMDLYRSVISNLIRLWHRGAEGFERSWTYQTAEYDQTVILEKECRYFVEAFLNRYLKLETRFENLQSEFIALSRNALKHQNLGFMHRDMQSRNIMVKDRKVYFIDFQGGRLGPIQYDLASLLIDPYVELPRLVQDRLLEYCIEELSAIIAVDPESFRDCYHYCCLTRNLQILGAFAHLSSVQGKTRFETYLPAAVKSLTSRLLQKNPAEFPGLTAVARQIGRLNQFNFES